MKKNLCLLLAMTLTFATLLTACKPEASNPPASSTPAASTPAASTPATSGGGDGGYDTPINVPQGIDHNKKEIYIGTTFATSGAAAFVGVPVVEALKATINRINAEGGINGYSVVLKHYDGQNNPGEDQALLEKLVEEDKVYLITGMTGNQVNTSMQYVVDIGIPVLYVSSAAREAFNAGPNVFPMQPASLTDGRLLAARVLHESLFGENRDRKLGTDEKIGVIYVNVAAGIQALESFQAQMEDEGRWDMCVVEGVEGTAAGQVEAAVQNLKNAGVSALVYLGTAASATYTACDDIGLDVPFFATYGNSSVVAWPADFYKPTRPIFTTAWADYTTAQAAIGLEAFYRTMEYSNLSAAEIEAMKDDNFARAGYCAGLMVEQGLKRMAENGPDWSWESLIAAMEQAPIEMITGETASYADGVRWGMTEEGMVEYYRDPNDPTKMASKLLLPFASLDEIMGR